MSSPEQLESIIDNNDQLDPIPYETPTFDLNQLPTSFKQFLKDNSIDPEVYTVSDLPRYVRINTHLPQDKRPTLEDLKEQLKTEKIYPVEGVSNFFSIQLSDTTQRISDIKAYKEHCIFGIDVSSAIAVQALEIEKDDQVLDLCCAPGAKLCMIANILGRDGLGTATGVDLAGHRLATCRSLLKKYKVGEKVRLFEADGTTFDVPPPSRLGGKIISETHSTKRQKVEIKKPFWASKLLRFDNQIKSEKLYDKVLVDAECTHDGSILHILKYEKWGWEAFEKNFMNPDRLLNVSNLQRGLMKQGWTMLKNDGIMIYSTCSLTIKQNEENVAWFLNEFKDAQLEKTPNFDIKTAKIKKQTLIEGLQDQIERFCIRFDPIESRTSGFFLARFKKTALK